ncbi:uncharacterized protein LOC128661515 [Bombina bombina]|uniref:uncharacterized protein LOC128661515 n=1 Tax=Bombina bombina TaxID=8345 RepID=UPI00235AA615|nr:uncharacterized protein LOC128661515 [Bombina bombina]
MDTSVMEVLAQPAEIEPMLNPSGNTSEELPDAGKATEPAISQPAEIEPMFNPPGNTLEEMPDAGKSTEPSLDQAAEIEPMLSPPGNTLEELPDAGDTTEPAISQPAEIEPMLNPSGNTLEELPEAGKASEPAINLNLNMDTSKPTAGQNDYFCALCNFRCATQDRLQTHRNSLKHARVEEAIENYGSSMLVVEAEGEQEENMNNQLTPIHTINAFTGGPMLNPPGNSLEEMLDACKATEPALGLEFIYEYHPDKNGNCMFDCTLCNLRTVMMSMFKHITGDRHKIIYLSRHHPEKGITNKFRVYNGATFKQLKEIAFSIENAKGRKKTNVSMATYDPQYLTGEYLCRSCILLRKAYAPDEPIKIEKCTLDYRHKSFQELKAEYEEELREAEERGEAAEASCGELKFSERDPVQIFHNGELFSYLKMFRPVDDDNLLFVIQMAENLSKALERYKEDPGPKKFILSKKMGYVLKMQRKRERIAAKLSSETSLSNDQGTNSNVQQGTSSNVQQGTGSNAQRGTGSNAQRGTGSNAQRGTGSNAQRGTGRNAQRGTGRNAQRGTGRNAQRGTGRNAQRGTGRNAQRGTGRNAQRGSGRNSPQRSGRNSPQRSGRHSPQRSGRHSPQRSGRHSPQRSGRHSPQQTGGKAQQQTGGKAQQQTGGKAPKQTGGKAPQQTGGKAPQQTGGKAPQQTGGKAPQQFGGNVPQQFGGNVPQQFGGNVPQQFGGNVPQQFGGNVPQQFGGNVPQQFGGNVPQQFGGNVPQQFGGNVPQQFGGNVPQQFGGNVPQQFGGNVPQQFGGNVPQQFGGNVPQQFGGNVPQQFGGNVPQQFGGNVPQQFGGNVPQQFGGNVPQQFGGNVPQQFGGNVLRQSGRDDDRYQDHPVDYSEQLGFPVSQRPTREPWLNQKRPPLQRFPAMHMQQRMPPVPINHDAYRDFPPGVPMNEFTARFFENVKYKDFSEVEVLLTEMSFKNPAFRGNFQ